MESIWRNVKLKLKKVFILCGPPGSGKSTWVREQMSIHDMWISRDQVRFSIVNEDEEYFSHEDEVFDTFIDFINQTLEDSIVEHVYVDATHINYRSRHNVLSKLRMKNVEELNCVCFATPLETCLERNRQRAGQERVPDTVIKNMFNGFDYPTEKEPFTHVYEVDENGLTKEV